MRRAIRPVALILNMVLFLWADFRAFGQDQLTRRYRDGEQLTYVMKGTNQGRTYEFRAMGVVKRDPQGHRGIRMVIDAGTRRRVQADGIA
jgi:hypothetical protein